MGINIMAVSTTKFVITFYGKKFKRFDAVLINMHDGIEMPFSTVLLYDFYGETDDCVITKIDDCDPDERYFNSVDKLVTEVRRLICLKN
jgi:hypothetical protein